MTGKELRDLDAEVHRRVMGRECRWVPHDGSDNFLGGSVWTSDRDYLVNGYLDPAENREIPRYSEDMRAAWRAVEALRSGGHGVRLEARDDGWAARVVCREGVLSEVYADSAPLAVCRAALAALWNGEG